MPRTFTDPLLIFLLWLLAPLAAQADIAVIVNPQNPLQSLSARQVSDIYLGRTRNFPQGEGKDSLTAAIYEYSPDNTLREKFFRLLNGMSVSQLNAYWARLRFSGEVLPPSALPDSRTVLQAVSRNRNGIGYVDAIAVDDSVKVVLRLEVAP